MITGFDEMIVNLQRLRDGSVYAAVDAVRAGSQIIYEDSQERVPVRTGRLKSTGRVVEPEVNGTVVTGGVSYGDVSTKTQNGTGYEVYTEFGTDKQEAHHYLTEATMQAIPQLPEAMGVAVQTKFGELLSGGTANSQQFTGERP